MNFKKEPQDNNKQEDCTKPKKESVIDKLINKLDKITINSNEKISTDNENLNKSLKKIKTMEDIANYIGSGQCKRIIILCGAGISTPCGIPDFRSPDTGIFANLDDYNLPYPEALFDIEYFKDDPAPFFEFSRNVLKNVLEAKPSFAHYFIKLLSDKGLLVRVYTQNIDGLEELAGIDNSLICCAHGSFKQAHCIDCRHEANKHQVIDAIQRKNIPKCEKCMGVIKPDIVFYGESLPKQFHMNLMKDVNNVDLLIVMGTSLTVQPISSVAEMIPPKTPRLLLNKTNVWKFCVKPINKNKEDSHESNLSCSRSSSSSDDYYMTEKMCYQDVFYMDVCDNGCKYLAKLLGWDEELDSLYNAGHQTKTL